MNLFAYTFYRALLVSCLLSLSLVSAAIEELSGSVTTEVTYGLEQEEWQSQELQFELEYISPIFGGDMTLIATSRVDAIGDLDHSSNGSSYSSQSEPIISGHSGDLRLSEFYWDYYDGDFFWRIGKQQVVWGEADGVRLLDAVNPQDFREFILEDFDDSRIPIWMVNLQVENILGGALQVLLIADTTVNELPHFESPFAFQSTKLLNEVQNTNPEAIFVIEEIPENRLKHGDIGFKYSNFHGGWDFSLNYLYHYLDNPVVTGAIDNSRLSLNAQFIRSHLIGASASTALSDFTLRTEISFETDKIFQNLEELGTVPTSAIEKSNQTSALIGLDYQGFSDQFISLQFFIQNSNSELGNDELITFLWESKFLNETLVFEYLHIHSNEHSDGVGQVEINYNLKSNLDLYMGLDFFYGGGSTLFAQFSRSDRLTLGLEYSF